MKNFIAIFLLFFTSSFFGQNTSSENRLSISFENLHRIQVIKEIEKKTNYRFYFEEDWFEKDEVISRSYRNKTINFILEDLFTNTDINFFLYSDNQIILTSNIAIRDEFLGLKFTDLQTEQSLQTNKLPLIIEDNLTLAKDKSNIVRIGKEDENSSRDSYIVTGYVRDADTNAPIANLALISKNRNTITDEKGFYSLRLPKGLNTIEAVSIGYSKFVQKVIIYNNGVYNFFMNSSAEMLDEVVIKSDKDDNVKKAIAGITNIKMEQIKTIPLVLGERDIFKVATAIPGIKTAGEASGGFNVRGGKVDQNLILLDDAVLYNPLHFFGIFSAINPFTTLGIDIYKGAIPAEYGGRLSSVFNLNTKEANYQEFKGEASIGPVTSNIALEIPIIKDKASLILGGRGTYSNWILRSLNEPSLNKSTASFYDVNLKYSHQISEKDKIEVSAYHSYDAFSISSDSIQSYSNNLVSLKWNHRFNDKNFGDLIVNNSQYKFNIEFDKNSPNDFNLAYQINETQLKLRMRYLAKKHKFTYGFSTKLFNVSPGEVSPRGDLSLITPLRISKERALESGIFISDDFELNKKLSFTIGVRYSIFAALGPSTQNIYDPNLPKNESTVIETRTFNNNDIITTYGGPELRASFRYLLSSNLSLKGGFNNTYQFIHILSNNTTATPTDTWRLSNLNIKPQQANQFSLGLFNNINGNAYELSLEGFYKNSKNILDYKVGADLLLNQQVENEVLQGTGKAYGVEFLVKKNKGRLNGWLGYSYSRSFLRLNSEFDEETVNNGEYFPTNFDKPHDFSAIVNWKLTKRYSFSANFVYQTGRPITYPVGSYVFNGAETVLFSDRNKFRIPDFYRLDIGVNIEGNHKLKKIAHSFWNFSIYNVLGRNNPFSVFFVTEEGRVKAYKNSIFAIPVPTITYNIRF